MVSRCKDTIWLVGDYRLQYSSLVRSRMGFNVVMFALRTLCRIVQGMSSMDAQQYRKRLPCNQPKYKKYITNLNHLSHIQTQHQLQASNPQTIPNPPKSKPPTQIS